jgi:transposase
MSNQTKQKSPQYTLEFKKDAAKLVVEKGYAHNQAADSLGLSLSALGRWVRTELGPATSVSAEKKSVLNLTDQSELLRLRKENEQLRMEREILKKAAVFPSTSSGQALRKKSSKVRVYSRATEDVSCYRVMSSHAGQCQRFLCLGPSA